jgi:hypothetical protein
MALECSNHTTQIPGKASIINYYTAKPLPLLTCNAVIRYSQRPVYTCNFCCDFLLLMHVNEL